MTALTEYVLPVVVLLALAALVTDRLATRTKLVAAQGALLGLLLLAPGAGGFDPYLVAVAAGTVVLKAAVLPYMLQRFIRASGVERGEPYIGGIGALVLGAAAIGGGFAIAGLLRLPQPTDSPLVVPASMSTLFIGLLILTSKRNAISQVHGYQVMENGIFVFGFALAARLPVIVEMGVLLDLFVAVFIMGITAYQISREFGHIDTARLNALQDSQGGSPSSEANR